MEAVEAGKSSTVPIQQNDMEIIQSHSVGEVEGEATASLDKILSAALFINRGR